MLISQIYNKNFSYIPKGTPIKEVVAMMDDAEHNAFVVVDNDKYVIGIITIQDIAASIVPEQFKEDVNMAKAMYKKGFFSQLCKKIAKEPVEKYARRDYTTVTLNDNIMTIITNFLENGIYIVPVVEDGKLIGIVARKEIKNAISKGLGIK